MIPILFAFSACEMVQITSSLETQGVGDGDASALDVQILVPSSGGFVNENNKSAFVVSGSCTEGANVSVVISGATKTTMCSGGGYSVTFDLSSLSVGSTYQVKATTTLAGKTDTDAISIRVASTSPLVTLSRIVSTKDGTDITTTNSTSVKLWTTNLTGDATQIAVFKNSPTCAGTPVWQTYVNPVLKTGLAAGANSLRVMVKNAGGNTSACSNALSVTVDNTAPAIAITPAPTPPATTPAAGYPERAGLAPASQTTVDIANLSSVPVSGTCDDAQGIVTFYIGSVLLPASDPGNPADLTIDCDGVGFTANLDLSALYSTATSASTVNLFAKIRDEAGNVKSSATVPLIIDPVPPTGSININSGSSSTSNVDSVLTLASSDAEEMFISNKADFSTGSGWVDFAGTYFWTLDLSPAPAAPLTVYVKFRDSARNESQVYSHNIDYDSTAAGVTIDLFPAYFGDTTIPTINFTGTCTDPTRAVTLKLKNASGTLLKTVTATCVDPGIWSASPADGPYDFGEYLSGRADGKYTISATHTKASGASDTTSTDFHLDRVNPVLSAISAPTARILENIEFQLTTDNASTRPIAQIIAGSDCKRTFTSTVGTDDGNITWTAPTSTQVSTYPTKLKFKLTNAAVTAVDGSGDLLVDPLLPFGVVLVDNAGNESLCMEANLVLDTDGPALVMSAPAQTSADRIDFPTGTTSFTVSGTGCEKSGQIVSIGMGSFYKSSTCGSGASFPSVTFSAADFTANNIQSATDYPLSLTTTDVYGNTTQLLYTFSVAP